MNWKKIVLCTITALLFTVPSWAGSFGVYGSYWDSSDAGSSWGGGVRVGFDFLKFMQLEFHGTYFPSFGTDVLGSNVDVTATPVDGGIRFDFLPDKKINVYAGAGASYYFMDSKDGSMDNTTGWYGEAGLEFGKTSRFFAEVMWRKMDTTLTIGSFDADAQFDGISAQAGLNWKWGK